jgi:hypothetical protein
MALENLKSVFKDSLDNRIEKFKQISPGGSENKSNLKNNYNTPILDSLVDKPTIDDKTNTKPATDNPLITFKTAGKDELNFKPLHSDGIQFYNGEDNENNLTWNNLYEADHVNKENPAWQGLTPISYGSNVNRDKLNIRDSNMHSSLFSWDRSPFLGLGAGEPYIVSDIDSFFANQGSREVPVVRSITDAVRLGLFMSSPAGIQFALRQNLLGTVGSKVETYTDGFFLTDNKPGLATIPQKFNTLYNPLSSIESAGLRLFGAQPNIPIRKDVHLGGLSYPEDEFSRELYNLHTTFGGNPFNEILPENDFGLPDDITNLTGAYGLKARKEGSGDKHTLMEFGIKQSGRYLEKMEEAHPSDEGVGSPKVITGQENGMPFYFKDMRDGAFIVFRAYLEGLTENLAPSWSSHNYVGRSEPVYTYERAEREVNFSLRLAAQSPEELQMIYKKMNRLTSLCYPEYVSDENLNDKIRMKPPLMKLRLGELFGKTNNELMGFIKSLSYNVEQSSPWEVEEGARVPRNVTATIAYQVIHGTVPDLNSDFYGYVGA